MTIGTTQTKIAAGPTMPPDHHPSDHRSERPTPTVAELRRGTRQETGGPYDMAKIDPEETP